jgi:hypothetical protein
MDFRKQPERLAPYLGQSFITKITASDETHAILRIGRDKWSRHDVATRLGVTHTIACALLSRICKSLKVESTKDLYANSSPYTFASYRAGVTTLYVMFAAFRDKGLDVQAWYSQGEKKAVVSFLTLKAREQEAEHRTKSDERKRQRRTAVAQHNREVRQILNEKVSA